MTITKEEVLAWLEWKGACSDGLDFARACGSAEEMFSLLSISELAWLLRKIGGGPWEAYLEAMIGEWDKHMLRRTAAAERFWSAEDTKLFFIECEAATLDFNIAIADVLERECTFERVVEKIKMDLQRPAPGVQDDNG